MTEVRRDILRRETLDVASIFISYRRSDSAGWAGRLHDSLQRLLPSAALFMDIEDIPPGVDFESFIGEAVSKCDLLIAIIGPQWLDAQDESGRRRLELEGDFTRIEIESALKRKIRVIPVMMGNAKMPSAAELPESLRDLAKRQNFELSDRAWDDNCKRLSKAIEQAVAPQSAVEPVVATPVAPKLSPRQEQARDAEPAIPSNNFPRIAVIAASLLAVIAVALVASGVLGNFTGQKSDATDKSIAGAEPDPPESALDLGLEGNWQLEDESGTANARVLIERTADTLRLVGVDPSDEREDLGVAKIEAESLRFDFHLAEMGALIAKHTTPGNWNISWEGASGCPMAEGTMTSTPDFRLWRADLTCNGDFLEVLKYSASLSSDGNTIRITIQHAESPAESLVLRRESQ